MKRVTLFLKKYYPALIFLVAVFLFVTFASQCSFLYRINEWNDPHCYHTVAMMMQNGRILYRDIMEQKGPYFYFLHYIAILISPGKYTGMYLIELLYGYIFAFFTYKTLRLFINNKLAVTLSTVLILFTFYIPLSFMQGDSVEEMMVPLYSISLYYVIKMAKGKGDVRYYHLIIIGIFAGIALFSKFSHTAFYFGILLSIFILHILNKNKAKAFSSIGFFFIGLVITFIPLLIYFGINGAYQDFFIICFYNNIFHYSSAQSMTIGERVYRIFTAWASRIINGYSYYPLILFGFFFLVFYKGFKKDRVFVSVLIPYIALNLMIVVGGVNYSYYGLPNVVFAFVDIVALKELAKFKLPSKVVAPKNHKLIATLSLSIIAIASFAATPNMPSMFKKEQDLIQYQMKDIIEKEEKPTILNYGFLDMGLYYLCNIQPTTKYFTGLNGNFIDLQTEQQRIVDNGEVTFVIARDDNPPKNIDTYYTLVYTAHEKTIWNNSIYYLYKLK